MKFLKPLRLGVLTRPFENERRYFLSVAVLVLFPFDQPDRLLPEISLWKLVATELGGEGVLDECMPKSTAEVLLSARAFPRGGPQPSCHARFQMGSVDRTLYVFGDRDWKLMGPTDPAPFSSMPLTYAHAFGGEGYAKNPLGKGYKAVRRDDGREAQPLPNVEDPKQLIRAPRDRPDPAALGPLDVAWPQRMGKAGTYDDKWLKERYPGFPADFDWAFYSVAPESQRFEDFLKGGEPFSMENMHPDKPNQASRLPTGVARCFLDMETAGGRELVDVPTRIDTVWLFPHYERGIVIYRGVVPVAEDDAADVVNLLAAYEAAGAPKPVEHYRAALAERLDTSKAFAVLRDKELLPEMPPRGDHPDEDVSDMSKLVATDRLVLENARRGAQKQIDASREELEKSWEHEELKDHPPDLSGLPEEIPALPPVHELDEVPDLIEAAMKEAKDAREKAEADAAEMEKKARAMCADAEVDYDEMVQQTKDWERRARRRYSAKAHIEEMEELVKLADNAGVDAAEVREMLADPNLVTKLLALEEQLNEAYRRFAHQLDPTLWEGDRVVAAEIAAGARAGQTFAGRDFTNMDLSGLDAPGVDLEGAFLEGTRLAGANLTGANLRGAVLARADLTGARLVDADLSNANAGAAVLAEADLSGAKLEQTILAKADFKGAKLVRAHLDRTDLTETTIEGADLSGAHATNLLLYQASLADVVAHRIDLTKTAFVEGTFRNVDLSDATCVGTVFMSIQGDGTRFDRADLSTARFVKEASFAGSSFREARMEGANLRGANLLGADFTDADLTSADLSEAKLDDAKLTGIRAPDALFVRTSLKGAHLEKAWLIQAILQKARVQGASFEGANLFRADAMRMRGDNATSFQGAFVKRVRMVPERDGDA